MSNDPTPRPWGPPHPFQAALATMIGHLAGVRETDVDVAEAARRVFHHIQIEAASICEGERRKKSTQVDGL